MKDYTVNELIQKINNKTLSIDEISNYYLNRIKTHDKYLNSISEINPDLDQIIETVTESQQKSITHGIPIVIKDNIQTKDQMHTTANSYALKDFIAPFDATIVKKIREFGRFF